MSQKTMVENTELVYFGHHDEKGNKFVQYLQQELNYLLSVNPAFKNDLQGVPHICVLDKAPDSYPKEEGIDYIGVYLNHTCNVYMFLEPISSVHFSLGLHKLFHEIGHHLRRKEIGHKPLDYNFEVMDAAYYREEIYAETYAMKMLKKHFLFKKNEPLMVRIKKFLGLKFDIYKFFYSHAKHTVREYQQNLNNLVQQKMINNQ